MRTVVNATVSTVLTLKSHRRSLRHAHVQPFHCKGSHPLWWACSRAVHGKITVVLNRPIRCVIFIVYTHFTNLAGANKTWRAAVWSTSHYGLVRYETWPSSSNIHIIGKQYFRTQDWQTYETVLITHYPQNSGEKKGEILGNIYGACVNYATFRNNAPVLDVPATDVLKMAYHFIICIWNCTWFSNSKRSTTVYTKQQVFVSYSPNGNGFEIAYLEPNFFSSVQMCLHAYDACVYWHAICILQ
jgi:hypothetical protein